MASSSPSEHEIQQRIRLACGRGAVRLWRNNTGLLYDRGVRCTEAGRAAAQHHHDPRVDVGTEVLARSADGEVGPAVAIEVAGRQ